MRKISNAIGWTGVVLMVIGDILSAFSHSWETLFLVIAYQLSLMWVAYLLMTANKLVRSQRELLNQYRVYTKVLEEKNNG